MLAGVALVAVAVGGAGAGTAGAAAAEGASLKVASIVSDGRCWQLLAAEDVSSHFWCTRKQLCVQKNWKFKHATRILDVIMLQYPVKVRPMPGMWIQSIPVTAIPWGRMKTEQHNLVIRSIRKHD